MNRTGSFSNAITARCPIMRCAASLALLVASCTAFAENPIQGLTARGRQELAKRPVHDFTQGGTKDDTHDWHLGPTGARGWMWGMLLRTDLARQILITEVEPGSPADGVLKVDNACEYIAKRSIGKGITGYVNAPGLLASGNSNPCPRHKQRRQYYHCIETAVRRSLSELS